MSCAKSQLVIGSFERESLINAICRSQAGLWKEWSQDMKLVQFWNGGQSFSLSGDCPHCGLPSGFISVTDYFREETEMATRLIGVVRCHACAEYTLAILRGIVHGDGTIEFVYSAHFPLNTPNDALPEQIPVQIRSDFQEAIRCEWIKAYKATVLMCRRSLQVSCDMEKAAGNDLYTQIDDLATQQKINKPLKDMAHRIRLLGKKGAHGDYSDIDDTITPEDASDAITFMRHYFEHVYVLPAKLAIPLKGTGKKRP